MNKKIVITGPESSGKSTLSKLLAEVYDAALVTEYAREYLSIRQQTQGNSSYSLEDVLTMAKEQLKRENETQNQFVFLDTDLTVFAIWIKEKYKLEIDWINQQLNQPSNKIYFLCDPHIDWEKDPLREHPKKEDRQRLFELYKTLLEKHQLTYYVISGDVSTRMDKCKKIIDQTWNIS